MRTDAEWGMEAKRMLRAEMVRRGLTYDHLTKKLAAIGVDDTAENVRMKVVRGRFTAVFLMQCLTAMGCRSLRLPDPEDG